MQMSHAYSQATQVTSRFAQEQRDQSNVETASSRAEQPTADNLTAEPSSTQTASKQITSQQVLANYDMTSISPTEVDQMASELRSSGFDDVGFILGLETRGENWRSHMQGALGDAGYEYDTKYNPNAATDLIASTKDQLAMATKFGEPTDFLTDQLGKMEQYHEQGHPQTAAAAPSAQMAETLVLFQAQRVWVE
jgi:hypothetical protein